MRRTLLAAAAAAIGAGLVSCGSSNSSGTSSASSATSSAAPAAGCSNSVVQKDLYAKDVLTVATDKPAYPPWFIADNPANGKGYESAVAYAVAAQLGFKHAQVKWVQEPFNDSYAPGPKKFDFDINEISYSPQRAQAVTFSQSYYDVQQALVALKGAPIVTRHSPAQLKKYVFGDQIGTTSLAFINGHIQPTSPPRIFTTLNGVKQAMQAHQIAALITSVRGCLSSALGRELPGWVLLRYCRVCAGERCAGRAGAGLRHASRARGRVRRACGSRRWARGGGPGRLRST